MGKSTLYHENINKPEETVKQLTDAEQIANHVCRIIMDGMQTVPEFAPGSIPIKTAATILGKTPQWIQAGIICGWFPVGYATLGGKLVTSLDEIKPNRRIDYTIIPKKFWLETGYVWKGEAS